MSAESPRHVRSGGPLTVPAQPPSDRSIIDAVSGFINDVTLSSSSNVDPKDVIQWARFETADINEPTPEGENDDISPLLLILGYGSGVQVWLIPPSGEAQEVLSWRQGTVRVLRILPTPQHGDSFASKRPLIALCDSASPGPSFCSLSFISIRGGEQVKSIKFKNPILDVLANKRSVVVSFSERFAVFDAATLEDRMAVTTCYPCPCPLGGSTPINPLALGDRWLAYADKKLNQSKRSSGGCEGEGVTSYTATVLHAAKSLSKGLRGLGESVAHSLAGGRSTSQSPSPPNADIQQPGVITILDIEGNDEEDGQDNEEVYEPIVAHFVAHSEAIIALKFDDSGMLLVTADRRGHDFHVFRINPHPFGPSLASVHHLYILHRGDTTAKVQDIAISPDARWAAISTLRGTTHVFAMSPYGGACGVRTHTQPRVVNRLSRFHRSAGLPIHAAAKRHTGSPVSEGAWFPNPRLPPYPLPTTCAPLAQLRPTANLPTHTITRTSAGRQRLSSLSEDSNSAPLLARARFGPGGAAPAGPLRPTRALPALYLVAASGELLHLVLHPRPARSVAKEKICDESPIEVEVESVSQWSLQRPAAGAPDLLAPLPPSNPLLQPHPSPRYVDVCMSEEERWLSQVEIVTHAGPHRRLWMGPQFVFKTYNCTGSNSSLSEAETVEVETSGVARSNPVNMPGVRPLVPVLVDSGSASSLEHSPSDSCRRKSLLADSGRAASLCDVQLREDLAEAMKEDHGGARAELRLREARGGGVERAVDPLGTVVAPPAAAAPPPPLDPDAYTTSNADEATFRPVVRAAPAPSPPDMVVRPLPRTTTIPVQTVPPLPALSPLHEPAELATHVLIPAALSAATHLDHPAPAPLGRSSRASVERDRAAAPRERSRSRCSAERVERAREPPADSLPESNRRADDIHPPARLRVKKSPTPKSDSDVSDVSFKGITVETRESVVTEPPRRIRENEVARRPREDPEEAGRAVARVCVTAEASEVVRSVKNITENIKPIDDTKRSKDFKSIGDSKSLKGLDAGKEIKTIKDSKLSKESKNSKPIKNVKDLKECEDIDKKSSVAKETMKIESTNEKLVPLTTNKEISAVPCNEEFADVDIKTEDQAWDLLLNEPERPSPLNVSQQRNISEKCSEDSKPKTKKYKKVKKGDDLQTKDDDDSFVEIHAIEDKQPPSGDLVSISTPYEDVDLSSTYLSKSRKTRSPKSSERKDTSSECDKKIADAPKEGTGSVYSKNKGKKEDVDLLAETSAASKPKEILKDSVVSDTFMPTTSTLHGDFYDASSENAPCVKETSKSKKSKSLSPYSECRKSVEKQSDTDTRDVYVINTTKDDFPEIQITRGTKPRKRSPQPAPPFVDRKSQEREISVEKPIKSWSSIAASKSVKKVEAVEIVHEKHSDKMMNDDLMDAASASDDNTGSSKTVSLQDKLIELCKRTDIMVAECDAPSDLTFIDEHHIMHDLPPLEPLDFGLDDFKLEVMRDSLLEVNDTKLSSPICKINIDDILSSIKETTSKAIESSTFNLIELEKLPVKKEKGFSVVEGHKITTQEINISDEVKSEEKETLEKSSDDDIPSPVLSADSDKEDKKCTGAASAALPSSKQSNKSKKSRRKKK